MALATLERERYQCALDRAVASLRVVRRHLVDEQCKEELAEIDAIIAEAAAAPQRVG